MNVSDKMGMLFFFGYIFLVLQVTDEDIDTIIPYAAYALAKIHMHLVLSG